MEYKLILASASPRRHQLMCDAGFKFEVRLKHTEEIWPEGLAVEEVPEYLAGLKAKAFDGELKEGELLITADTVVCLDAKILGKPETGNMQSKCYIDYREENIRLSPECV